MFEKLVRNFGKERGIPVVGKLSRMQEWEYQKDDIGRKHKVFERCFIDEAENEFLMDYDKRICAIDKDGGVW